MLTALDWELQLSCWAEVKKAEAKLADLKKEMWRTESEKQGDCLSIEYGNLMEM